MRDMANGTWTQWTTEKETDLLQAVVDNGGNRTAACEFCNVSRSGLYKHCADSPEFKLALDEAVQCGADVLEDECRRRAFAGCDEPVYYQGVECGRIRKYSDLLAIFLLKGARPDKYRDRSSTELSGPNGKPIAVAGPVFAIPEKKSGSTPDDDANADS